MKATTLKNKTQEVIISSVGKLFTEDEKKTGILACVSMAQFILESAYGKSELAQIANNCFGMKKSLSGNTWSGTKWDGKSTYLKETKEQNKDGSYKTVKAYFRSYDGIEQSIADHSAYLLGAMNGSKKRYKGLKGEKDYRKALQIIKDGGYATSLNYVDNLCKVIETWDLTKFNYKEEVKPVKKYKVYVDAGHGGSDPGAKKYITEKNANLTMALACQEYLESNGVTVKMSRTKDVDKGLAARCNECNKFGADLAVSIHCNAGGGDGFEVYHTIFGGKGKTLAKNIEAEVKKLGQNSRGLKTKRYSATVKRDYYAFNRDIDCPSIICEAVFVDNKLDVKIADTKSEQRKFGYAYARGILKTLGLKDGGLK